LSGCFSSKNPQERIEGIYKITLPKDMTVEYNKVGETFTGRPRQYAVFKLAVEPTEFLQKNSFVSSDVWQGFGDGDDKVKSEKRLDEIVDSLKTPAEFRPNWQSNYSFKSFADPKHSNSHPMGGGVSLLYFPDEMRLIAFVSGY